MKELLEFWIESSSSLIDGLCTSLEVTAVILIVGIPLGLIFALGVESKNAATKWATLIAVEIGRGAPALVLLQLVYFGLPTAGITLTSFAATALALSWNTAAYTSEIIRAGIDAVPYGEKEAAASMGFSKIDTLRYVVLPQGLRVAAPALLGFAVLLLQATSLSFTVALPELTSQAHIIGSSTFRYMAILSYAGILYAMICIPATITVSVLEKYLGKHTL